MTMTINDYIEDQWEYLKYLKRLVDAESHPIVHFIAAREVCESCTPHLQCALKKGSVERCTEAVELVKSDKRGINRVCMEYPDVFTRYDRGLIKRREEREKRREVNVPMLIMVKGLLPFG